MICVNIFSCAGLQLMCSFAPYAKIIFPIFAFARPDSLSIGYCSGYYLLAMRLLYCHHEYEKIETTHEKTWV